MSMKNKFKELKEKFIAFNNTTYGMLIVVSWVVLLICLVIKLFGGNWFELWWDNEKFISFCNYVENTMWLKTTLSLIICLLSTIPIYNIILNQKIIKLKPFLVLIILTIIKSIIGWYNSAIAFVLDIFILLVLMTLLNKSFKRSFICFIIINAFQIITLLARNFDLTITNNNFNYNSFIIQTLFQIDYYIMILLFYLYNFNKRKEIK